MKDDKTPDQKYAVWLNCVNRAWREGWRCETEWIFRAPGGTYHDLSAADFNQLAKIEYEGLFAV